MSKIYIGRESHGIKARHVTLTTRELNGDQVVIGSEHPLPQEDHFSAMLHEGYAYSFGAVADYDNMIASDASLDLVIAFGSGVKANMSIEGLCGGIAHGYLYEGANASGGTSGTAVQLNRNSTNSSNSAIIVNPTVTSTGTLLGSYIIQGGVGKKAAGGTMSGSSIIMKPLTNYLLRITNKDNQDHAAEIVMSWFEES